jgi:hypothetical protein
MHSDRAHKRKGVSALVWIEYGGAVYQCMMSDVSQSGAKIVVSDLSIVPDRFRMFFSPRATNFRVCDVRWRRDGAVGVQFANTKGGAVERV